MLFVLAAVSALLRPSKLHPWGAWGPRPRPSKALRSLRSDSHSTESPAASWAAGKCTHNPPEGRPWGRETGFKEETACPGALDCNPLISPEVPGKPDGGAGGMVGREDRVG